MILQKFIENLRENIRRYVMDKDPQTLLEATKLCDHYVANISGSPGRTRKQFSFGNNSHQESNHGSGNSGFKGATRFRGTEGHSVRFEVEIIQATLIRINISRINHTNNINKDTIQKSIKVHQHQRMPRC